MISNALEGHKSSLDLHRLWERFFSPVCSPEQVITMPKDWAPFFTVMLLSPNHFQWAKSFLASQA